MEQNRREDILRFHVEPPHNQGREETEEQRPFSAEDCLWKMGKGKKDACAKHCSEVFPHEILQEPSEKKFFGESYAKEIKQQGIRRDHFPGFSEYQIVGKENDERHEEPQGEILEGEG